MLLQEIRKMIATLSQILMQWAQAQARISSAVDFTGKFKGAEKFFDDWVRDNYMQKNLELNLCPSHKLYWKLWSLRTIPA